MQLPPGDECSEVLRLYTALLHNVSVERPASAERAEPLVLDPSAPSRPTRALWSLISVHRFRSSDWRWLA